MVIRRKRTTVLVAGAAASVVLVAALYAGGFAIVSVRDLPEYAVAGEPLQLTFTAWRHGVELLAGLRSTVAATSGTETLNVPAVPTGEHGEYSATLVLPRPVDPEGIWREGDPPASMIARLVPGVRLDDAAAEATPVMRELLLARLVRLNDEVIAPVHAALHILPGAVAVVLLIACTNVAGLGIARSASRRGESAIRVGPSGAGNAP